MNGRHDGLVETMTSVAQALASATEPEDTLDTITTTAVKVIPSTDFASISMCNGGGEIKTLAPTADVIVAADQLQYRFHEGPCVEAVDEQATIRSPHVATDVRWPRYGPRAAALGLRSQMAVELFTAGSSRAALNLYSATPGAYHAGSNIAELFATHAAVAMGFTHEVETLREAIETRQAIGKAVGIVMQRYELDEDRAFGFLVRVSQKGNIKLRLVAEEVICSTNQAAK